MGSTDMGDIPLPFLPPIIHHIRPYHQNQNPRRKNGASDEKAAAKGEKVNTTTSESEGNYGTGE
ncbi:hypothetical protein EG328_010649 [Venturia inaequalis]|uniref:Uncharacterized protein n=1 Tax=Venturia inaequalis TaxID=5025 RepID=A0A8H3V7H2_VENIN|nr:hypothetical protein EG328_010649 [Venturia inaequalis]